jgi:hypothetical protein
MRKAGYTGPIYLVLDNEDESAEQYCEKFGRENVIVFDKQEAAKITDVCEQQGELRGVVYARNAIFDISAKLGYRWFLVMDDDYNSFIYRINGNGSHPARTLSIRQTLGDIIDATFRFYQSLPDNVVSIAFSQGGDWFGGRLSFGEKTKRKAMNSFFCCTERRFRFTGRINEDVNAYVLEGSRGKVFFTLNHIQLCQSQTQKNSGGLTEIYLDLGTYVKSFYTIICSPSCVSIDLMGEKYKRLHHDVSWNNAVPLIISDKHRKEL